eukprot:3323538-Pyramimonas_sp.AAC.1
MAPPLRFWHPSHGSWPHREFHRRPQWDGSYRAQCHGSSESGKSSFSEIFGASLSAAFVPNHLVVLVL